MCKTNNEQVQINLIFELNVHIILDRSSSLLYDMSAMLM